jgi:hypothetical protein
LSREEYQLTGKHVTAAGIEAIFDESLQKAKRLAGES